MNKLVAVLTALVFAPLSAVVAGWLGKHFPGVHVDANQLVALEVAGFVGALAMGHKYLDGLKAWQELQAKFDNDAGKIPLVDLIGRKAPEPLLAVATPAPTSVLVPTAGADAPPAPEPGPVATDMAP